MFDTTLRGTYRWAFFANKKGVPEGTPFNMARIISILQLRQLLPIELSKLQLLQ